MMNSGNSFYTYQNKNTVSTFEETALLKQYFLIKPIKEISFQNVQGKIKDFKNETIKTKSFILKALPHLNGYIFTIVLL